MDAEAADLIDRLVAVLREAVGCSDAMKLASTHPALTKEGACAWRMAGEELESAIKDALPDYDRVCREVHEANVLGHPAADGKPENKFEASPPSDAPSC